MAAWSPWRATERKHMTSCPHRASALPRKHASARARARARARTQSRARAHPTPIRIHRRRRYPSRRPVGLGPVPDPPLRTGAPPGHGPPGGGVGGWGAWGWRGRAGGEVGEGEGGAFQDVHTKHRQIYMFGLYFIFYLVASDGLYFIC